MGRRFDSRQFNPSVELHEFEAISLVRPTMTTILWIAGVFVGLFIILWMNAIRGTIMRNRELSKQIAPAITAVQNNHESARELVLAYAREPATRNHLFSKLAELGKAGIFPKEYRSIERIAESDLVRWLTHPNELGSAPDEIELARRVEVQDDEKSGCCFLFRFRIHSPHWAADHGWMAGIAGPFWDDEPEPGTSRETFSELTPYDTMTDEEHVKVLKKAMQKKGLVVPS